MISTKDAAFSWLKHAIVRVGTSVKTNITKHPFRWGIGLVLFLSFYFCLPRKLFQEPTSTVLLDRESRLLGARIASDGQWRFPESEEIPEKFAQSIIAFEDKRFYFHWGVDPLALFRAIGQNIRGKSVVSGASTLTMQVIRLSGSNPPRTAPRKLLEMIQATRLEFRYSKKKILALYAAHAPFGGNVVGLDAAAWKYFGRKPDQLTWAESALLAVLPNAPGLIHPGKRRQLLEQKRNKLLRKLRDNGAIDSVSCALAIQEPLPEKPLPLPSVAPHLLDRVWQARKHEPDTRVVATTLDRHLQEQATEIVNRHYLHLREQAIYNAAALILDTKTGAVLAYVGNTPSEEDEHGGKVDIITSRRSSGSILKPFLYAAMQQEGELLPAMLTADIPTYYRGFSPANFDHSFRGAVPADQALARSLNVPASRWLNEHSVPKFHQELRKMGFSTLFRPAEDYGIALILGGAEVTLWDLAGAYASLGRSSLKYFELQGKYEKSGFRSPHFYQNSPLSDKTSETNQLTAGACWLTLEALTQVNRPEEDMNWEYFSSSRKVAWKTGTSYGFRDAWAVGVTPGYTVAVWVGNADGEGRPDLIGGKAAAPLMFDLFGMLPSEKKWFARPEPDLIRIPVCKTSGYRPGPHCAERDTIWACIKGEEAPICPFHQTIHLDATGSVQVNSSCASPSRMINRSWLVFPPTIAYYYQILHPDYLPLPPWKPDCTGQTKERRPFELVYPGPGARIYIPLELDGQSGRVVFEVAHRQPESVLYWHLDDAYLGQTTRFHSFQAFPSPGKHTLTVVDANGESVSVNFEVISQQNR